MLKLETDIFAVVKIDGTRIFDVMHDIFILQLICGDPVKENESKYWPYMWGYEIFSPEPRNKTMLL